MKTRLLKHLRKTAKSFYQLSKVDNAFHIDRPLDHLPHVRVDAYKYDTLEDAKAALYSKRIDFILASVRNMRNEKLNKMLRKL